MADLLDKQGYQEDSRLLVCNDTGEIIYFSHGLVLLALSSMACLPVLLNVSFSK
jgi:hypothetical protein